MMAGWTTGHVLASMVALAAMLLPYAVQAQTRKLNMPRILVPFMDNLQINSTLEFSEPGCFKWSTSRSDVVRLTAIQEDPSRGCSSGVVVSSSYRQPHRATAIILAEDYHTGETVRCDAIVDVISSLAVVTTSRELFIEEVQEEFEIRAYDDKGNEFTTLDGVPFAWETRSCRDADSPPVLRIVPYRDTPYESQPSIDALERAEHRGSRVLLEGLRAGCALVTGRLKDPFYKDLESVQVRLSVVANLVMDPAEVYVVPGGTVVFRVLDMQGGHYQEVEVPSRQYHLEVEEDDGVATLDRKSVATALRVGGAKIILRDGTVRPGEEVKEISALLHVRAAHHMALEIAPHRNWALMVDEVYGLEAEVYDSEQNRIRISDNMLVDVTIPRHFEVLEHSRNGTYYLLSPIKSGEVTLDATLKGTEVRARAKAVIHPRVYLEPRVNVLPWDPVLMPKYHIQINVTGGGDRFQWRTSNTSVCQVDSRGHVRTSLPGSAVVRASMVQNEHNYGVAAVHVQPVMSLDILQDEAEGEVGFPVLLDLAMYTALPGNPGAKVGFSACNEVPFRVVAVGGIGVDTFKYDPVTFHAPEKPACAVLPVMGQSVGRVTVKVSYEMEAGLGEITLMSDTVRVSTFRALQVLHPSCGMTLLAVGSSRVIVFEGGPRPFTDRPTGFIRKVMSMDESIASVSEARAAEHDTYTYRVTCHSEGETEVSLTLGNNTCATPVIRTASVVVICAAPTWLQLKPLVQRPQEATIQDCPSQFGRVATQCYLDLELDVVATDDQGRRFDNVSGVAFEWRVSSTDLVGTPQGVLVDEIDTGEGYKLCGRTYQIVTTRGKTGRVEVTATIPSTGATASVDLELVEDLYISPPRATVFNHPSGAAHLIIHQGSGHFEFEASSAEVARLTYHELNRTLDVAPLADGAVKVVASDVCLTARRPAVAHVHVSDVHSVEATVADKVELGGTVRATVKVYDGSGVALPAGAMALMGLRARAGSDIITVKVVGVEGQYVVQGDRLGDTTLTFSSSARRGREVRSVPQTIQVFPPLRLSPRNVTLYVGTVLQVSSHGGPQPDAAVEYSVGSSDIARVCGAGILEGAGIGRTKLRADAVGGGGAVTYSTDSIDVYVVPIERIRIHAPVTRLRTGTRMPLHAVGADEHQTPALFAADVPFARFEWSVDNRDVATLTTAFGDTGIDMPDTDRIGVRVVAKRAGRVVVTLRTTVNQDYFRGADGKDGDDAERPVEKVFQDHVEIEVFEELRLLHKEIATETIVMAPATELQLRTNRDGTAKISYRVAGSCPKSGLDPGCSPDVVTVDRNGVVVAGDSVGRAVVVVTVQEEFGLSQSVSVVVEVKPVTYTSLTSRTRLSTVGGLGVIPRGSRVSMAGTYHDGMGLEFHATRCRLRFRATRLDLVQVSPGKENNTLTTAALRSGRAVLKVWCESERRITDYVMLSVGDVMTPDVTQGVTLGDIVCFQSPLTGGKWQSNSKAIQFVGGGSVATASATGVATVSYHVDADVNTHADATVRPATKVHFLDHNGRVTDAGVTSIRFVLSSDTSNRTSAIVGRGCENGNYNSVPTPFRCTTNQPGLFLTGPGFESGAYRCILTPLSPPTAQSCTKGGTTVRVTVTITAVGHPELHGSVNLPVMPGFFLHTPELHLSNVRSHSTVVVSGIPDVLHGVRVTPSDSSLLTVGNSEFALPDTVRFAARLTDAFWSDVDRSLFVTVQCEATRQKVTVPVRVTLGGGGSGDRGYCIPRPNDGSWSSFVMGMAEEYYSFLLFPAFVAALLALYFGYHMLLGSNYYPTTANQSAFLNQSGLAAVSPPVNSSGMSSPSNQSRSLWSQQSTPYYGSPQITQRSPRT